MNNEQIKHLNSIISSIKETIDFNESIIDKLEGYKRKYACCNNTHCEYCPTIKDGCCVDNIPF